MKKRRIEFAREIGRLIRHLPPGLKREVRETLTKLASDPTAGKALRDELAGLSSYRVGKSRIIYRVTREAVEVVAFGPRRFIYETVAREIKRSRGKGS